MAGRAGQPGPAPAQKPAARKPPVKRKLALGEAVACCAAEALVASLRLAGWPVSDRDVLALYELTAGDADEGASILATLEAAAEHGLAGTRPGFSPVVILDGAACPGGLGLLDLAQGGTLTSPLALLPLAPEFTPGATRQVPHGPVGSRSAVPLGVIAAAHSDTLILGVDLPGPHALCDDGTAWWSWGQPYDPADFPAAVIEEAWTVTWPR